MSGQKDTAQSDIKRKAGGTYGDHYRRRNRGKAIYGSRRRGRDQYQNRKDMAMVYSKTPCRAAGVFTTNVVKAAPVLWDKEVVESEWEAQAIVVNSGIANA